MTATDARYRTVWSGLSPRQFLAAPFQRQTYKNLIYLVLAFPLGLAYFVGFTVGSSLGASLLIIWVGFPILIGTLVAAQAAASLEATLARTLVGVDATAPVSLREFTFGEVLVTPGDGFFAGVLRLVTATSTWLSVFVLLLKFGFGIGSFVALVVGVTLTAVLLGAPLLYDQAAIGLTTESVEAYTFGPWVVDSLPEAVAVSALGVVSLFVVVTLLNVLATVQATAIARVLATGNSSERDSLEQL
jgi:hypothetical protein